MSKQERSYVTKYQNEMNLVPLKNFNAVEIDLFFAICTKLKDEGVQTVKYDFTTLKSLSNYSSRSRERFINDLERIYDKMLNLTYTKRSGRSFEKFVLFTHYKLDDEENTLEISINPKLEHILNNLTGNFTRFELQELTNIQSGYSKNMFRLLKQYRRTGFLKIDIEDFRERLDIPNSYQMSDIDKRVLKIIHKDLQNTFIGLKINKIKKSRKISHLEFTFQKEEIYEPPQKINNNKIKSIEMTPQWLLEEEIAEKKKLTNNPEKEMTPEELEEYRKETLQLIMNRDYL